MFRIYLQNKGMIKTKVAFFFLSCINFLTDFPLFQGDW